MKNVLAGIFIVLAAMSFQLNAHDMRLAHYLIYVLETEIICEAKIDIEDLEKVLQTQPSQERVYSFVKDHLKFRFDGQEVVKELKDFDVSKDWVEIRLALKTHNTSPDDVEVYNDILSEEIDGHDNLMRFVFHDRTRIFRLNENRKQVSFSYE